MGLLVHLNKTEWSWYLGDYPRIDIDDQYFPFKLFLNTNICKPEITRWVADNVDQQALITDWSIMQYDSYLPEPPYTKKRHSITLAIMYFSDLSEYTAFKLTFGDCIHTTFISEDDHEHNHPKSWCDFQGLVYDRSNAPKFPVEWNLEWEKKHRQHSDEMLARNAKEMWDDMLIIDEAVNTTTGYEGWHSSIETYKKHMESKKTMANAMKASSDRQKEVAKRKLIEAKRIGKATFEALNKPK